jgi:hypothetical protein
MVSERGAAEFWAETIKQQIPFGDDNKKSKSKKKQL